MAIAFSSRAEAAAIVLDFEGIRDQTVIGDFYNQSARDFNITFSDNALGLVDADAGGTGNIGGEPSPSTVMFFLSGQSAFMNVHNGFTEMFSVFYSAPYSISGTPNPMIRIYEGLEGQGSILATLGLPLTNAFGKPDPQGAYSPLVQIATTFAGTARSVEFVGPANYIVFDDVKLGCDEPVHSVPEPMTILGSGVALGMGWRHHKRLRKSRSLG